MKSYRAYSFHHTRTIEASFTYKTGRYSIIISVTLPAVNVKKVEKHEEIYYHIGTLYPCSAVSCHSL